MIFHHNQLGKKIIKTYTDSFKNNATRKIRDKVHLLYYAST